ncbi:hypothetical protein [Pelagibaculum spongiae]|uniref:Uncharacterized protein n=1 Tax=Pelagibaculum spongiae TaxID=2080658 RepID=A0A2V1GQ56_9GAMM|nr:hypothetical protein [Pelagibaculum spongiae]PVZ64961.1 hypothetical protein DC094_19050 [Pelagibaculum spongiae]
MDTSSAGSNNVAPSASPASYQQVLKHLIETGYKYGWTGCTFASNTLVPKVTLSSGSFAYNPTLDALAYSYGLCSAFLAAECDLRIFTGNFFIEKYEQDLSESKLHIKINKMQKNYQENKSFRVIRNLEGDHIISYRSHCSTSFESTVPLNPNKAFSAVMLKIPIASQNFKFVLFAIDDKKICFFDPVAGMAVAPIDQARDFRLMFCYQYIEQTVGVAHENNYVSALLYEASASYPIRINCAFSPYVNPLDVLDADSGAAQSELSRKSSSHYGPITPL